MSLRTDMIRGLYDQTREATGLCQTMLDAPGSYDPCLKAAERDLRAATVSLARSLTVSQLRDDIERLA